MSTIRTHPWREEEDSALRGLIETYGRKKWKKVGEALRRQFPEENRSNIQCRERFYNHLRPGLKKGPWHEDEKRYLFFLHKIHANNWSYVGKCMPWRTENSIKSFFHALVRRSLTTAYPLLQVKSVKILVMDRTITKTLGLDNGEEFEWTYFERCLSLDTWRVPEHSYSL